MLWRSIFAVLSLVLGNLVDATERPIENTARAELLYSTYCIACHDTQVHWRDKKLSTDWMSLRAEVNRWQETSALGWDKDDIVAVARYLNRLHYHYPTPD